MALIYLQNRVDVHSSVLTHSSTPWARGGRLCVHHQLQRTGARSGPEESIVLTKEKGRDPTLLPAILTH